MGYSPPTFGKKWLYFCWKILKIISNLSAERDAEIGTIKDEFRKIYIEALDFVVHFIDLRFNQPNFKGLWQSLAQGLTV